MAKKIIKTDKMIPKVEKDLSKAKSVLPPIDSDAPPADIKEFRLWLEKHIKEAKSNNERIRRIVDTVLKRVYNT